MPVQSFSTSVIRPKDLLILSLEFRNVDFEPSAQGKPARISGGAGAYLIVRFQPQHVIEQAFFQSSGFDPPPAPGNEWPPPPGEVQSRLAGPSRLVFRVPPGESFDYTLDGLLEALTRLPQSVSPLGSYRPALLGCLPGALLPPWLRFPAPPVIAPPGEMDTAIEAPYRLILSPDQYAQWSHALGPVTHGGLTELWHTRLGTRRSSGVVGVRAIWSPDFMPNTLQNHWSPADHSLPPFPFRTSLDSRDRNELVHLTSNWYLGSYVPLPVDTERLMLTTLGAWLRLQGDWQPPSMPEGGPLTVEQWRHIATMGRDHYVRVVYAGYLFPLGHRAVLVKVTERKFFYRRDAEVPGMIAYLYQRMFIVIRQPTRTYRHRDVPFRTVTIKTRVTPDLADPSESDIGGHGQSAFWPRIVTGPGPDVVDFHFLLSATDWEGRTIDFTAPLIFVDKNVDETDATTIVSHYNTVESVSGQRRQRGMGGQSVAFAPSADSGDTTLETASISFGAMAKPGLTPHFWPSMAQALVDVPAVKQMLGKSVSSTIVWEPTYTQASGQAIGNAGHVFAKINSSTPLDFAVDKAGGLVAPNIGISGLSRAMGPVGGIVDQMVSGNFKPQNIFDTGVKLLGGIELWQIIQDLAFSDAANAIEKLPAFVSVRDGDVIRTSYKWKLSQQELVDTGLFVPKPNAEFSLEAIAEVPLDGSAPALSIDGKLTNFSVVLLPTPTELELVHVHFNSVEFTAEMGKKPDVDVQLGAIEFKGILEYVARLMEYLPLDGFSDPPNLSVGPDGINVGFSFGIPTIGLGIMTMQNISLGAAVYLPFVDKPLNFHFAFCERHQPFVLTVSMFGGGGFFSIDIGIAGVQMLEAALEFGASVALNLGVASGKASIMGGFYFQMAGADFALTGYFRAAGSLSVLGIITVSCEFYLGLTYASKGISPHGGTLWGQAKLTVKIEILFFSTSVSISMEREFAGSDPTFQQLVAPSDWVLYCDAFADYA